MVGERFVHAGTGDDVGVKRRAETADGCNTGDPVPLRRVSSLPK